MVNLQLIFKFVQHTRQKPETHHTPTSHRDWVTVHNPVKLDTSDCTSICLWCPSGLAQTVGICSLLPNSIFSILPCDDIWIVHMRVLKVYFGVIIGELGMGYSAVEFKAKIPSQFRSLKEGKAVLVYRFYKCSVFHLSMSNP
jgi:hypothetical protein